MQDEVEKIKMKMMEELVKKFAGKDKKWPNKPVKVTDSSIDGLVSEYPLAIIDCWAPWCGPCRMVTPVIDQLAKEMQGKVVFAKLNTDENRATSLKYGIMSIPTLLLFKNGKLADRIVGALPPDMLKDWVERYL
ncbi:MAG: thioredoxin [Candidatus Thermoplasmatota archaeon]|nr:thioredoxin [Candidatus Thermoplasmatota archaeon]